MALPALFRGGTSYSTKCDESDIISHETVYHTSCAKDIEMVKDLFACFPKKDITVFPLIDWHRKHRSVQLDGKTMFLHLPTIEDDATMVQLPVHGAAASEDWLSDSGPDYFVVKHRGQLLFVEREKLKQSCFPQDPCPYRSAAKYICLPLAQPGYRPPFYYKCVDIPARVQ